ncbi:MAG TPA: class I SAM-dependent methyltransferase [Pyrinomonadaceae bacterium]|jgi:SAM-dependent methyltransferase|nr:class I SAM-dependent methyltransferase [Pyrinomonadaceae bacterium]
MDPLQRFSTRADNYVKYRPTYPAGVVEILKTQCGLTETSVVADVGSGTGILTKLLLDNGNVIFAIEPNAAMRLVAEKLLSYAVGFRSLDANAEATTLAAHSVDFATAAQAFHWFDRAKAKREFARILKPGGWVVLIWNERRLDSTAFLRAYEDLLLRYGTDYQDVRHEKVTEEIAEFFAPDTFELQTLENVQHFDFESLKGRLLSSSYAPDRDQPNFAAMLNELEEIFNANQKEGIVNFEYETKVYYGHLSQSAC